MKKLGLNERYYREFVAELEKVVKNNHIDDFLEGILTPGELEQVVKRLQIIKKLKKDEAQRDIAGELEYRQ